jgi:hypothetical protein
MKLRPFFLIGSTGFWLIMMSLLIHRELFQFTQVQNIHQVLSIEYQKYREEYRAIYLGKERIGFNFNVLDPIEKSEREMYELRHTTYLSFLFLGQEREMVIKGKAILNRQLHMQRFQLKVTTADTWTEISGEVVGNNLAVEVKGKQGNPIRQDIPVQGVVFFSEALNFIWTPDNLKFGKSGKIQIWNPLLLSYQTASFQVREKTQIEYENKNTQVYVVHLEAGGIETRAWISPEGIVLREETTSGLILQKEPAWQIFDAMRKTRAALPDLPNLFSIPSNLILKDPTALNFMRIQIKTPQSEKQLDITKNNFEGLDQVPLPVPVPIDKPEVEQALEDSPWLQIKSPQIVQKAKEIIGNETKALEASLKLMKWVHEEVLPVPTVNIPQAQQVLASKRGDCNEYTVLFTALARAAGIPTKMVAGVVYQNGRFFYHAWAEVYLGRWISFDPTFGQAPTDVTHIPLVEGDLQEQITLAQQMGRIKVFILDAK